MTPRIRRLERPDIDPAVEVIEVYNDERHSSAYREKLRDAVSDGPVRGYVAETSVGVVGVSVVGVHPSGSFPDVAWGNAPPLDELLDQLPDRYGYLSTTYVSPEYTGDGVGTDFTRRRLSHLREQAVTLAAVEVQAYDPRRDARRVMDRLRFELVHEGDAESYWPSDICSKCGPTCTCAGLVYVKRLTADGEEDI